MMKCLEWMSWHETPWTLATRQGLTPRDLLLINHVVLSCCIVPTLPGGSSAL